MQPRSKHWHMLDYIITRRSDRGDVCVTKAMCGAECWTDHRLVISKLDIHIRPKHRPQGKKAPPKRLDTSKLKEEQAVNSLTNDLNSQELGVTTISQPKTATQEAAVQTETTTGEAAVQTETTTGDAAVQTETTTREAALRTTQETGVQTEEVTLVDCEQHVQTKAGHSEAVQTQVTSQELGVTTISQPKTATQEAAVQTETTTGEAAVQTETTTGDAAVQTETTTREAALRTTQETGVQTEEVTLVDCEQHVQTKAGHSEAVQTQVTSN
ncbi:hypothetical protein AC249_AIPGENE22595 [Exaiptasia diaphana]|nr:hypothetical protein AC249_AIPGENE22595 [Exaiptasia diaphana]